MSPLRRTRLECKLMAKYFLTISSPSPLIWIANPISRQCNVFPTKVRLPWIFNCRYKRWLGVSFIDDGFILVLPSSWQTSTSTLQSFWCHADLELGLIRQLSPLVTYTLTDLNCSPSATFATEPGVRTSSSVSFMLIALPLKKTSVVAHSVLDRLYAALSCHLLLKLSVLSLTIWSSSRQSPICFS